MSTMVIIKFVIGFVLLVAGAELLVRGAARLAAAMGISALVIGLTVVAFGTSSPELAVSLRAALSGGAGADIALGNVVGSNIFNILLIVGLSALAAPLLVSPQLIRADVPIMIAVSFLTLYFAADGHIARGEGLLLFLGLILYILFSIYLGRKQGATPVDVPAVALETGTGKERWRRDVALIAGGLVLLGVGSHWLVNGAVAIARLVGLSELVISLTIIAAGTSLPELATSVLASLRGQREISVGNVVGSNIFNLLCVLGLTSSISPTGVAVSPVALRFDIPVMIAVALISFPIFLSGYIISRKEGLFLVGLQVVYTSYLVIAAKHVPHAGLLGALLLLLVIAVPARRLLLPVIRRLRARRESA